MVKILLLNQYRPSSTAPTGSLIGDLAEGLEAKGYEVKVIGARGTYESGRKGLTRWILEVVDLLWLGVQVLASPRPDRIIALSSPPGLIAVAALGAAWHRSRLHHWVMDVYPEVAVASGLLRNGPLAEFLGLIFNQSYRRCDSLIALDEDMAGILAKSYEGRIEIHAPWPPALESPELFSGWDEVPEGHYVWLYSGNLGRAHLWEPLVQAQSRIESETDDIHLVIQGGGLGWECARAASLERGLSRAHCTGYVPRQQLLSSLLRADLHVVTQAPEMRGLIWPSKLALLNELEAPLIWLGPGNSHLAKSLAALTKTQTFTPDEVEAMASGIVLAIRSGQNVRPDLISCKQRVHLSRQRSIELLMEKMGLES